MTVRVGLEPYHEYDLPSFVALLNAIASSTGAPRTSEAEQQDYESWLHRDLTKARVVVRHPKDAAELVAYADLFIRADKGEANLSLGLHPNWQGGDLESKLFDWLMLRAQDLQAGTLNIHVHAASLTLRTLLENRGFKVLGTYQKLEGRLPSKLSDALLDGYTLRSHEVVSDVQLYISTMNRSYSDMWGHGTANRDVWNQLLDIYPSSQLFLLFYEQRAVGCVGFRLVGESNSVGIIDAPGLVPEHRSSSLYRAVVAWLLGHLFNKGVERIVIDTWGESDETIEAYKNIGLNVTYAELGYAKSLGK